MRPFLTLVLVGVISAMMASPALANRIIFQDDFEGHAAGTPLASVTPTIGASYDGDWTIQVWDVLTDPPRFTPPGGPGYIAKASSPTTYSVSMYISASSQAAVAGRLVRFNWDMYMTSDPRLGGQFVTFAPGWARGWDIQFHDNGTVAYYNPDLTEPYVNPGVTFRPDIWVPVEVMADYSHHTFEATVDGNSFTGDWAAAGPSSFERFLVGLASAQSRPYVDNVSVVVLLEQGTVVIVR